MCVCGDDHVTCYMGVDVDAGEHAEAQRRSGNHYGRVFLRLHYGISFCNFYFGEIGFVMTEYCDFKLYLCNV